MIEFQNDGLIPIEAFTTFGVNAKPNTKSPIGYFGTGLKYAVAVTLRMGGTFRLWIGETEYEFYTKKEDFRGEEIEAIRMKKRYGLLSKWSYERLPFTTVLGKNWKPWMVIRELESNCRDENGHSGLYLSYDELSQLAPNQTRIIVDHPELDEAYDKLDTIFLTKNENKLVHGKIGSELEIYNEPSQHMYYRGLRVYEFDKPALLTYNFNSLISLTEDRTVADLWWGKHNITEALKSSTIHSVIDKVASAKPEFWESDLDFDTPTPTSSHAFYTRAAGLFYVSDRVKAGIAKMKEAKSLEPVYKIQMTKAEWKAVLKKLGEKHKLHAAIMDSLLEQGMYNNE